MGFKGTYKSLIMREASAFTMKTFKLLMDSAILAEKCVLSWLCDSI